MKTAAKKTATPKAAKIPEGQKHFILKGKKTRFDLCAPEVVPGTAPYFAGYNLQGSGWVITGPKGNTAKIKLTIKHYFYIKNEAA